MIIQNKSARKMHLLWMMLQKHGAIYI